jgi:hypothetical protein
MAACTACATHYRSGAAAQRVRRPERACSPHGWERSQPALARPARAHGDGASQGGTTSRGALHHRQWCTPARTATREPSVATTLTGNMAWLDGGTAAATRLPPAASSTMTYGEDGGEVSDMQWSGFSGGRE